MVENKSDRLHNKGRYHKGQYKVTFLYIKSLHIQKQKAHDNLYFPLRRVYLLLYVFTFMQESIVFSSIPVFIFSLGKHHVVGIDPGIYIQLDVRDHELLLLTLPLR